MIRGEKARRWGRRALVQIVCGAFLAGCSGSPLSSRSEDEARVMIPVPICLQRLPRRAVPGSIVSLTPVEYWSLLLPGFDAPAVALDPGLPDCSGRISLGLVTSGAPKLTVRPDEMVLGSGADGFKIAWLPVEDLGATKRGLLALFRQGDVVLEVYALGVHHGVIKGTRFALERMGPALVVTAFEERCQGESDRRCDASCKVYLMGTGRLSLEATFPVDHAVTAEPPTGQGEEYRFSASANFTKSAIVLSEKLSITEKGRGEVSSTNLERALRLEGGRLVPSSDSLWVQTERRLGLARDR